MKLKRKSEKEHNEADALEKKGGNNFEYLGQLILTVRGGARLLQLAKLHEVRRAVLLVVKLLGIGQLQFILHVRVMPHTLKVIVPRALRRHHEEAEEAVGQQHLHFLIMRRQISLGIVALIGVLSAPLKPAGRELVRREGARAGREAARHDDGPFAVPRGVVGHDFGVGGDVLGRELGQLVGLGVEPAQRFHLLEVAVLGQAGGQVDGLVGAPLRGQHDAADFFHLGIVGRTHSVKIAGE